MQKSSHFTFTCVPLAVRSHLFLFCFPSAPPAGRDGGPCSLTCCLTADPTPSSSPLQAAPHHASSSTLSGGRALCPSPEDSSPGTHRGHSLAALALAALSVSCHRDPERFETLALTGEFARKGNVHPEALMPQLPKRKRHFQKSHVTSSIKTRVLEALLRKIRGVGRTPTMPARQRVAPGSHHQERLQPQRSGHTRMPVHAAAHG